MRILMRHKFLVSVLACMFSTIGWTLDKGRPASDVVVESAKQTCKDEKSGRAGINPKILSDDEGGNDFVLAPQFSWVGSGFDDVLPEIDLDPSHTYIFHVTTWHITDEGPTLKTSSWYVYHTDGTNMKQSYRPAVADNLPFIYGGSSIFLLSVEKLETVGEAVPIVTSRYQLTVTQKTPQNVANLIAVGSALLGVKGVGGPELLVLSNKPTPIPVCVETFSIHGGHPPYDLKAEASFTFSDPSKPASGGKPSASQSGPEQIQPTQSGMEAPSASIAPTAKATDPQKKDAGSSVSRTFNILDKEYWDINLGLNIPSVNQPAFSLSKDNVVQRSISKKVSPYAFLSIYPFAAIAPKDGNWPHINLGMPVAGQPLHRPFGGIAEKIPWLDRYTKIPISVFGGAVALKESISTLPIGPTSVPAQFALRSHWVWRGMFGLEFPVSSLIDKIGKK